MPAAVPQAVPILPPTSLSTTVVSIESPNTPQHPQMHASTAPMSYAQNSQVAVAGPQPATSYSFSPPATTTLTQPNYVTYPTQAQLASEKKSIVPHANPRGHYTSKRIFKVIIIGDAGVGKTCLSFRFCNNRFPAQTEATIGVDFRERTLALESELIRVQLWDTAGQERYRQSIVAHYYRNVNAVVFVYDVNNPASFRSLPAWISECKKHSVSANDVPHILIGNKCDVNGPNRVRTDTAQVFADKNDMALFETSALSDSEADHVEAIFMTLVHKLQQCKPMHVQSDRERTSADQTLLLKARDVGQLEGGEQGEGWCC